MDIDQKQESYEQVSFQTQKATAVSVQSEYKIKYLEFFNLWKTANNMKDKKQINEILSKHQIEYCPEIFHSFTFRIVGSSPNFQICETEVCWGFYKMRMGIINSLKESNYHQNTLSEGCFGKIYQYSEKKNNAIIKCCCLCSDSQSNQKLKRMIFKQYFISRIAAAFNIGPKIISQTGFDISVYLNCIQFSIERCKKLINIDLQSIGRLCQGLQTLHSLKIIHFDIKPENIMWSSSLKREVFIDFGLSEIIDCDVGSKYYVNFKGTPNYCTEEMLSIFQSNQKSFLDVYFNDVSCLQQSLDMLLKKGPCLQIETIQEQNFHYQSRLRYGKISSLAMQAQFETLLISQIKSSIYYQNKRLFNELCVNFTQKNHELIKQILQFLSQNYSSQFWKQFYNKFVPVFIKNSYKYEWINSLSNSLYFKSNKDLREVANTRALYDAYYVNLVNREDKQSSLFFITKKMAQNFIHSNEFKGGDEKLFKILMSYISFTNNIYRCTVEEKLQAVKQFIRKVPNSIKTQLSTATKISKEQMSCEENLLEILAPIIKYILEHFITNPEASSSLGLDKESKLQLIFDVLEHCFLFKSFNTDAMIKILSNIYQKITKEEEYKLEMVLKIRRFNQWFLFANKYSSQLSFSAISKWALKMEENLFKQNHNLANKISQYSDYIYKITSQTQFSIFDDKISSSIIPSLMVTLIIEQFFNKLYSMNPRTFHILLTKVQKMTPYNQKRKLFSIHLYLFFTYHNKFKNYQQRDILYHRFKQNIQSSRLIESSIIDKIMKMSHKTKIKEQMSNFIDFLSFINIRSIEFMPEPIESTAKILQQTGFEKLSDKQHKDNFLEQFGRILNDLKKIDNQKFDDQDRIFRSATYTWFQIKIIYLVLKKQRTYDLSADFQDLQDLIQKADNNIEIFKMKSCLSWMKQHSLFILKPRNYITDIINIHTQLKQYHSSLPKKQQNSAFIAYLMHNYLSLVKICYRIRQFSPMCEQAYFKLYQFTKDSNSYYYYIYLLQQCPIIIYSTLYTIICKFGFLEVAQLIRMILISVHYVESFFYLGELIQSFYKFIIYQQKTKNYTLFTFLEEYFLKYQDSQPYIIIYYFSCLVGLSDYKQKKKYCLKVLRNITRLPQNLKFSFDCFFYHSLLHQLLPILQILENLSGTNDEMKLRRKERKRFFTKKKLIKAQIISLQRDIIRFQLKNIKNPLKKSLFSKCYKIQQFMYGGQSQFLNIRPIIKRCIKFTQAQYN